MAPKSMKDSQVSNMMFPVGPMNGTRDYHGFQISSISPSKIRMHLHVTKVLTGGEDASSKKGKRK